LKSSFSFYALKGYLPNKIVYNNIPDAHISVAWPKYFSFAHNSGDIYAGVPQNISILLDDYAANPKSIIFVFKFYEFISTSIFSGFISL
jgi:hypothetical protein